MRVAVEGMSGVTEAAVSLNEGEVVIELAEANDVTLERLRDAIRDQGFTPREADVRLGGTAESREGGWFFLVPESEVRYRILADPEIREILERREGQSVVVRGRVGEETPGRIEVTSVEDPKDRIRRMRRSR